MARMPDATWKPIAHSSSRISQYDILCIHTTVGSLAGTYGYFQSIAPGVNSHFCTGGLGEIWQFVDTAYWSGANLNGNWHVISVENADMGPGFPAWGGSDVPAFTAAQIEAIARICVWAHLTHGIPLTLIPDTTPGRRGIAYHRQGVDPYRVSGGEKWSNSYGKICPGNRRVAQIPQIIARANEILEGDDMPTAEEIANAVWSHALPKRGGLGPASAEVWLQDARLSIVPVGAAVGRLATADEIAAATAAVIAPLLDGALRDLSDADVQALASAVAPAVATQVIAAIGEASGLTEEQVEAAVRRVFASAATQ